jgi:ribonuclease HI
VTLYTDGGCIGNPGPGGYGVVLLHGENRKELSGGYQLTTNNRMEIRAVIAGLEALKSPCKVSVHSDSRYLVDAISKGWAEGWQKNGWRRNKTEMAINPDLWERLLELCDVHRVTFQWTKGHAGDRENERCDQLAMRAASQENLPEDESYDPDADTQVPRVTHEGQPCRKCTIPVVKRKPRKKPKPGQKYYYEYYFYCPNCETAYWVEEAKRPFEDPYQQKSLF